MVSKKNIAGYTVNLVQSF